jgi:hypothetical protein
VRADGTEDIFMKSGCAAFNDGLTCVAKNTIRSKPGIKEERQKCISEYQESQIKVDKKLEVKPDPLAIEGLRTSTRTLRILEFLESPT